MQPFFELVSVRMAFFQNDLCKNTIIYYLKIVATPKTKKVKMPQINDIKQFMFCVIL